MSHAVLAALGPWRRVDFEFLKARRLATQPDLKQAPPYSRLNRFAFVSLAPRHLGFKAPFPPFVTVPGLQGR